MRTRFFFLFLFMIAGGHALACSCAGPGTPAQAFRDAKAVFTAHVAKAAKNANGHATGFMLATGRVWKGDPGKAFTLGLPHHGCAYWNFEEGKDYLVYAQPSWDKERPDEMNITMCSRTKPLEQAQIETRYLDAAMKGESTDALDAALPKFLLGAQDAKERAEAAALLGEIFLRGEASAPKTASGALTQAARDESPVVRLAAARTLGIYKLALKPGVKDALLALLQDKDRDVRAAATGAFGAVMWRDSRVFGALREALTAAQKDPHPDRERQESLLYGFSRALAESAATEAEKDAAVDLLLALAASIENPYSKVGPIQHLGFMGGRAKKAAPAFLSILKGADSYHLKQYTILALGDIGAIEAQPVIEPYLHDKNCYVAQAAAQAVHKMNAAGFPVFFREKAMPAMKARFDACAAEFIWGLQAIGPAAREMEPFLKEKYAAMDDGDWKKQTLGTLLDSWRQAAK